MDKREKIKELREEIAELESEEIPLGSLCYLWDGDEKHLGILTKYSEGDNYPYYCEERDIWYGDAEVANKEETPLPWVYCNGRPDVPDFKYCVIIEDSKHCVYCSDTIEDFFWNEATYKIVKYAIINLGEMG